MKTITRRKFLNSSMTAGLALGMPRIAIGAEVSSRSPGPNDTVRVAVIGLGSTTAVGGVGGRGNQLIPRVREVPGARIVALGDVDQSHLDREAQPFKDRGEEVTIYRDLRRVLDDKTIDAVVIAKPGHWHALATVWACQAGKDVYVEKNCSLSIWEGRKMIEAARKYGRIVQVGTQNRSAPYNMAARDYIQSGKLGKVRLVKVFNMLSGAPWSPKPDAPTPVGLDWDMWLGPAPARPYNVGHHRGWYDFWTYCGGTLSG